MTTITIPKKFISNDDLVIIPRKQYESLLRVKHGDAVIKRSSSFKVPKKHKKFYDKLDKELTASLRQFREGKSIGPFDDAEDLISSLKLQNES